MKTKLWSLKDDTDSNFINISKTHILVCNKTDCLFDFCSPMESTSNLVPTKFSNSLGIFQFKGFCTSCLLLLRFSWPHPNLSGFSLYVIFVEKFTQIPFLKQASLIQHELFYVTFIFFCISVIVLIPMYKYFIYALFYLSVYISLSML